ncbi:MAG: restriction endonuclease subunit S [Paludibacteraceae bacterium]|nr:restriction endonuclease subunit S [Paludibacteraceae bacterium]
MAQKYKYLHLVNYNTFLLWDIKRYFMTQVASSHPIVKLGDYIQEEGTKYNISDKTKTYGILGVNNQTGIFDAYEENGSKIKQKYKKMQVGWIAYNPYRVNVGSIGIRIEEHLFEYISPAYVVFSCKKGLLPEFLFLLMKTDLFNKIIRENTTGSVRQNLNYSVLSNLQIPLPSLAEQNKIIAAYNATIAQAKQYSTQAKDIDKQIEKYLNIALGIEESSVKKHESGKLYFMSSNQLTRWDVWNVSTNGYSKKYPLHYLHNVITMQSGKFLPSKAQKGGEYNVYGGNGLTGTHNEFCFTGKRIVIGRVGEYCGNVHLIDGNYWITDNALKVDKIADEVTWDFLAIALQALNINQYRSISAQPSISQTKILQLQIPIPPLHTQNEIVEHITRLRNKQKDLQQKSLTLRQQATQQFEQTIFN